MQYILLYEIFYDIFPFFNQYFSAAETSRWRQSPDHQKITDCSKVKEKMSQTFSFTLSQQRKREEGRIRYK